MHMLIARGVLRRDVSHDVVDVAVEELWSQLFGEVVGHVEGGVDTFQFDESKKEVLAPRTKPWVPSNAQVYLSGPPRVLAELAPNLLVHHSGNIGARGLRLRFGEVDLG